MEAHGDSQAMQGARESPLKRHNASRHQDVHFEDEEVEQSRRKQSSGEHSPRRAGEQSSQEVEQEQKIYWAKVMPRYQGMTVEMVTPAGESTMKVLNEEYSEIYGKELGAEIPINKESPVYYFSSNDKDVLPFLLMKKNVFELFKRLVHYDAFGDEDDDYGSVRDDALNEDFILAYESDWYYASKIPGDLNAERYWKALQDVNVEKYDIFLNVDLGRRQSGLSPLVSDDSHFPKYMRKWRHDTKFSGDYDPVSTSVHHLEDDNTGLRITMISSNMFFNNWNRPSGDEQTRMRKMITFFQETYQVDVWNAPEQHAIVFNIPPETLAALIVDPVLGPEVLREIKDAALGTASERPMFGGPVLTPHAIDTWKQNYLKQYPQVTPRRLNDIPRRIILQRVQGLKDGNNWEEVRRVFDCEVSSPDDIIGVLKESIDGIEEMDIHCAIIEHARRFEYLKNPLNKWCFEFMDQEEYDRDVIDGYLKDIAEDIVASRQAKPVDSNKHVDQRQEQAEEVSVPMPQTVEKSCCSGFWSLFSR
jgi:hypothetical protein